MRIISPGWRFIAWAILASQGRSQSLELSWMFAQRGDRVGGRDWVFSVKNTSNISFFLNLAERRKTQSTFCCDFRLPVMKKIRSREAFERGNCFQYHGAGLLPWCFFRMGNALISWGQLKAGSSCWEHAHPLRQTATHIGFQIASMRPTWRGTLVQHDWSHSWRNLLLMSQLGKATMDVCYKYTLAQHVADSMPGTRGTRENSNQLAHMQPFIP